MSTGRGRSPRCRGFAGFVLGHKFKRLGLDHTYPHCTRCGIAPGTVAE